MRLDVKEHEKSERGCGQKLFNGKSLRRNLLA